MRRPTPEPIEAGGQDSFVDVVTNLVGIMIVLVLIVGVRVKHVWIKTTASIEAPPASATFKPLSEKDQHAALSALEAMAASIKEDVHRVNDQVAKVEQELNVRGAEREQLATLVSAGEHVVAEHRSKLALGAQEEFDLRQQASALEQQLQQTQQTLVGVETAPPAAVEVKHYLTPISRTVFGKEEHFRLLDGRIAYIPLAELFERAKSSVRSEIPEVANPTALTERQRTAGPVNGFEMRYTIALEPQGQGRYDLRSKEWQIVPATGVVGESIADALRPTSELRRQLALMTPRDTTITIWVYPDSFSDYRKIKDQLYLLGFATAARPLPPGAKIAGSDKGSRSAAQ